jgi:Txe/YoeB family toxin of toxin-antitoxin system
MYQTIYSSEARKDAKKVNRASLKNNALKLIEKLHDNPYQKPPPYEKLLGDLLGSYSRRINIQY